MRLPAPLPPGSSTEVTIELKPLNAGRQYVAFGLLYSQVNRRNKRPIGEVIALPVTVAPGTWVDNHRVLLLRSLVAIHTLGFVLALVGLVVWTRNS